MTHSSAAIAPASASVEFWPTVAPTAGIVPIESRKPACAERLGLTGEATPEQLLRLLDGRHPITGRRIVPYRTDPVAGVDQTASAPKSVSVVWAVGAPEERRAIEDAQDAAVSTVAQVSLLGKELAAEALDHLAALLNDGGLASVLGAELPALLADHRRAARNHPGSARPPAPERWHTQAHRPPVP